jgi:peptide/nickel transport system substrate-binding protein
VQNNGPYAMLYQPTRVYAVRNDIQGFIYDPTTRRRSASG